MSTEIKEAKMIDNYNAGFEAGRTSNQHKIDKLIVTLKFAKDMMVANNLELPNTFETIDDVIKSTK